MKMTRSFVALALALMVVPSDAAQADQPADVSDDLGRFNVRSFGAKGDGQADDTQAFQAAVDAAAEVIVITPPSGKLTHDGRRTLVDNIVVEWQR